MDTMGRKSGEKVGLVGCHGQGGNQVCNCAPSQIGNPLLGGDVDTTVLQFQKFQMCRGFHTHTYNFKGYLYPWVKFYRVYTPFLNIARGLTGVR